MISKPLLKAAASWVAIAAFAAACATTPAQQAATAPAATPEAAQAFVDNAERELMARSEYEGRVAWVYSTNITYDTEWLLQRADAEGTETRVRIASEAAQYQGLNLTPETQRKLNMLRLGDFLSMVLGPKIIADSGEWGTYAWNALILGTPGGRIAGGSDEVMRNIVGERVLGLPKEPGIDSTSPFKDLKVGTQKG